MPNDGEFDRRGIDAQPEPFDARKLEPAKKRRRSRSPDRRARSPQKRSNTNNNNGNDDDQLPQPYNAKELMPAKRRAASPSSSAADQPRARRKPGARARISEPEREAIRRRQE